MFRQIDTAKWICLLPLIAFARANTAEFIKADSDYGELHLVQNQTGNGEWSALYIDRGIYFKRESNRKFCTENNYQWDRNRCTKESEFYPKILDVKHCSHKSFPHGLFQSWFFEQLDTVTFDNVTISDFHPDALLGANALRFLILSHNALTKMPSQGFANAKQLVEIDLSSNEIATMASDVFKYESNSSQIHALEQLTTLYLHNNKFTFIDVHWFTNLKSLKILKLNDNRITELDACDAFRTNTALLHLRLENNNFTKISTNGLSDNQCLNKLISFDISNNFENNGSQIIRVNAATINITYTNSQNCFIAHNTVEMYASHNQITEIVVDFLPNEKLQQLYLDHNRINSTDFLFDLEHLRIIDLSHNQLTQLNVNIFVKMAKLKALRLAFNQLTMIDLTFLQRTPALNQLDLSNNRLTGVFQLDVTAVGLSTLNISNNQFTLVQHNLKVQAPNLTEIDFNGNAFDCEDLASIFLFLNMDHVRPVVRTDANFNITNNIRGIGCINADVQLATSGPTKLSYESTKQQLIDIIDEKFGRLEKKLVDLLKIVSKTNLAIETNKIDSE